MPKFTLITEHTDLYTGDVTSKTTHEFEVDYLPDVLENIELFLRGAGFVFDGNLDFVNDFHESQDFSGDGHDGMGSTLADYENHSEYYFDTQRNK